MWKKLREAVFSRSVTDIQPIDENKTEKEEKKPDSSSNNNRRRNRVRYLRLILTVVQNNSLL